MEEELKQAFATQNVKLDKISQALYGDESNPNQKGLVHMVSEHEIEIQSFKDYKSKGKLLWKLTVAGLTLFGYLVGKGFEHVVYLFSQRSH
jgi:hypothetical protein